MQSTLDYKTQNEILKKYLKRLQQELDVEREAIKEIKSDSNDELLRLESFIVTISDTAKQISSVLHTDELLRVILRKAIDLLSSERCALLRVDSNKKRLLYIDSVGYKKNEIELLKTSFDPESGIVGYAIDSGIFVSSKTLSQDYTKRYILDKDKLDTSFCQPIVHNGKTLAVICVGSVSPNLTHEQVMRLLSTLSNFGSIALENTKLVDEIREQSVRDSLTWLYNHQFFQSHMEKMLKQAKKDKDALGFIIMDVDHFKQFNDTYGHQAGDFVLKEVAKILTAELRGDDIIARYGGEEFVAVLPRRDINSTYDIAERLRKLFEKSKFNFQGNDLSITISAGAVAYNPKGDADIEKDKLIKYADDMLYKAKETGRNRVMTYKT